MPSLPLTRLQHTTLVQAAQARDRAAAQAEQAVLSFEALCALVRDAHGLPLDAGQFDTAYTLLVTPEVAP